MGDPDRGYEKRQPGAWCYNLLPYLEMKAEHDMGKGQTAAQKMAAATTVCQLSAGVMHCPTMRANILFPDPYFSIAYNADPLPSNNSVVAHGDYASNCGSQETIQFWGPSSYAEGDNPDFWSSQLDPKTFNGIIYERSVIAVKDIPDGTSHTLLFGEKYLNPDDYLSGLDGAITKLFIPASITILAAPPALIFRHGGIGAVLPTGMPSVPHTLRLSIRFSVTVAATVLVSTIDPTMFSYLGGRNDRHAVPSHSLSINGS